MARISQSQDDLEAHLADHIQFLRDSGDAFDSGKTGEAKRLAVSLRVLFHDTRSSHSLLGQLGRLGGQFLSTASPLNGSEVHGHVGLATIILSDRGAEYVASLDDVPHKRWMPFAKWWTEPVFVDDRKTPFSRRDLVLAIANQDGGAHVDPSLDEAYTRLSRQNSLGWVYSGGTVETPLSGADKAAVRQIAHEALITLLPDYSKRVERQAGMFIAGMTVIQGAAPPALPPPQHFGRNDPCPCGSGKKYKRCHGSPTRPG